MKNKYLKQHLKEQAKSYKLTVTIIDSMFFGLVVPMAMFLISFGLDAFFHLPQFIAYLYDYIIGLFNSKKIKKILPKGSFIRRMAKSYWSFHC